MKKLTAKMAVRPLRTLGYSLFLSAFFLSVAIVRFVWMVV